MIRRGRRGGAPAPPPPPRPPAPPRPPPADARDALRVRLEEAALNATAVRAQVLYDGWLVRYAPSSA
ncbi:hypothetical protein CV044_17160, partial [Achromobacter ruhlandii]